MKNSFRKHYGRADKMVQRIKEWTQDWPPKFDLRTHMVKVENRTPMGNPLVSTHRLWHKCTQTYTSIHKHMQKVSIKKLTIPWTASFWETKTGSCYLHGCVVILSLLIVIKFQRQTKNTSGTWKTKICPEGNFSTIALLTSWIGNFWHGGNEGQFYALQNI